MLKLLFPALVLAVSATPVLSIPQTVLPLGNKLPIPSGYKSYSFFLICNPEWLDPSKSADLTDLYNKFLAFGRSIGDDQAAVWFWKTQVPQGWEKQKSPADVIDVERSIKFCRAWNLAPSEGPYLVVTAAKPDESNLATAIPDGRAEFKLGGLKATEISKLLGRLTDALLLHKTELWVSPFAEMGKPTSAAALAGDQRVTPAISVGATALWVRLLAVTQEIVGEFGCAVSFKLDAGPVSADVKPCKNTP